MTRVHLAAGALLALLLIAPQTRAEEVRSALLESNPWAEGTGWSAELDWLDVKLQDCRAAEGRSDAVCGPLVAETLDRVYGVGDFREGQRYLDHGAIGLALAQTGSGWRALGTADDQAALDAAQAQANEGNPVLAVLAPRYGGHVTIILPGRTAPSASWGRKVPNSASFFIGKSRRSFIGKRLSFAYDSESASAVTLYSRTSEPAQTAEEPQSDAALANGQAAGSGLTFDKMDAVAQAEQKLFESALAAARLAPAAGTPANDDASERTQLAARQLKSIYGIWCNARADDDSHLVEAVKIDQQDRRVSWGLADRTRAYAFEDETSHAILEIEQEGAIVGISFSQSDNEAADATAFFVIDGGDKLFESHIFDETSGEIRARDVMLRRCRDAEG